MDEDYVPCGCCRYHEKELPIKEIVPTLDQYDEWHLCQ